MGRPFVRGMLSLVFTLCVLFLGHAAAEEEGGILRPINPDTLHDINPAFAAKRGLDDLSVFDLLDQDVYIWGNPPENGSDFNIANMTFYAGDNERVVSLETFRKQLKSVECGEEMRLAFNDKASFEYAIKSWGWVNDNETHQFILVSDHPACAGEDHREPFLIYDVDYDEENYIAYLYGDQKEWADVAHDIDLFTGVMSYSEDKKRGFGDWVADLAMGIAKSFTAPIVTKEEWEISCTDCGTTGKLHAPVTVKIRWFSFDEMSIKVTHENIGANFDVKYTQKVSAEALSFLWAPCIIAKPLPIPYGVPGVLGLQAKLQVLFSVVLQGMAKETTITTGVRAGLPKDSVAAIDLMDDSKKDFSGWKLGYERKPVTISNHKIKASLSIGPILYVSLGFRIFKWGLETGLHLKPEVVLSLDGFGTPGTTCPEQNKTGISFAIRVSASVFWTGGVLGQTNFGAMYAPKTEPLWSPGQKRSIDGHGLHERSLMPRGPMGFGKCKDADKNPDDTKKLPFSLNLVFTLIDLPDWTLWETCIEQGQQSDSPKPTRPPKMSTTRRPVPSETESPEPPPPPPPPPPGSRSSRSSSSSRATRLSSSSLPRPSTRGSSSSSRPHLSSSSLPRSSSTTTGTSKPPGPPVPPVPPPESRSRTVTSRSWSWSSRSRTLSSSRSPVPPSPSSIPSSHPSASSSSSPPSAPPQPPPVPPPDDDPSTPSHPSPSSSKPSTRPSPHPPQSTPSLTPSSHPSAPQPPQHPPPSTATCRVGDKEGVCKNVNDECDGHFDPGTGPDWACPEYGEDVECCIEDDGGETQPPVPQEPDGECKAPTGKGQCGEASDCRGMAYSDLCPNSPESFKCCVEIDCSGADPKADPQQDPVPMLHGLCKWKRDGCSSDNPPLRHADNSTRYDFQDPVGEDNFICPEGGEGGDSEIKCCAEADTQSHVRRGRGRQRRRV